MAGPAQASVVCESGTKISYTEPSTLGADGRARFSSVMRMTSTIYKVENTLLPKEYKFKVQVIRQTNGLSFHHSEQHQRRKTVARTKVNLAEFCTLSTTAAAQIVDVPLSPQGSLTLSIRAVWLQNWKKSKSSRSGGTSENESETDFSSVTGFDRSGGSVEAQPGSTDASNNCADLPLGGGVLPPPVRKQDRTSSADLSSLADYHLRINSMTARQAAAAVAIAASIAAEQNGTSANNSGSSSSDGRLRDALTARIVPKASSAAAPVAVGGRRSSELLVASSAVAASANRLGRRRLGAQSERSMIAPILECEEAPAGTSVTGSVDGSSASLEREKALSAEALRKHIAATSAEAHFLGSGTSSRNAPGSAASNSSSPPRVRPPSQRQLSGSSELPDSILSEESRHGAAAKPLSQGAHLPQWMWPFAKEDAAAKEVTTDELMRQIGASGNDAAKLQQLCRGLLCERNDWRFKATQWERNAAALQDQVDAVQHSKTMIQQQLQVAEAQLSQLQANALLDKLVEAKLQLAQVDLQASTLKGELKTERQRYSKLTTQLVTLQLQYDGLQEQHKELQEVAKQQQRQLHAAGLGDSCQPLPGVLSSCRDDSGDMSQGEGLALQSSHSANYAQQPVAALSNAPQVKRNMSSPAATTAIKDSSSSGSGSWNWGTWIRPMNSLIRSDSSASGSTGANGAVGAGSASSISSARLSGTPAYSSSMNASSNSSSYRSSSLQRQTQQAAATSLQQNGGYTASSLHADSRRQGLGSYDDDDEPRSSGSSDQGRFGSADRLKRSAPLASRTWGAGDSRFGVQ